jgi:hypothetical protein
MRRGVLLLGAILGLVAMAFGHAQTLADDEQVIFLPGTGRMLADGKVEVRVDAWVFERENRPGLSKLLARYLGLDLDDVTDSERELFYQRTQLFRVDSENSKGLRVEFAAGVALPLPITTHGGRSRTRLTLDAKPPQDRASWLEFHVPLRAGDDRRFGGRVLVVPPHGLSVISDIDDTIKYSNVLKKKLLILNTFARAFVPVPCMAERYQQIEKTAQAPSFHYVSSSPIQLYPPIAEFLSESGFPDGSVHLRESTSIGNVIPEHDDSLRGRNDSRTHKIDTIRSLLADFPDRMFLLIGDSGELDPEIYGDIAREFPRRIVAIRIRDVTGDPRDSARYAQAFAKLAPELWTLFADAPAWQAVEPAESEGQTVKVPAVVEERGCL